MRALGLVALTAALALAGCGFNDPEPADFEQTFQLQHTREYVWEEIKETLGTGWTIESEDLATGQIVTAWVENLAPMNTFGTRERLIVTLAGDLASGYQVTAAQETEQNTNENNPLSSTDADWSPTESSGVQAERFLLLLTRRLYPRETWREDMIR
jgi:hypothetical protein